MITDFFRLFSINISVVKKSIFLVLTLAIPVAIFLFLKLFGDNAFEVPILFDEGITDCPNSVGVHVVPEFEYVGEGGEKINSKMFKDFLIFGVLDAATSEINKELIVELVRIQDAFYEIGVPYFVLFIKGKPEEANELRNSLREIGLMKQYGDIAYMDESALDEFLICGIALINDKTKSFTNFVLVDTQRRIRGFYDGLDMEETDRLIAELKILKPKS